MPTDPTDPSTPKSSTRPDRISADEPKSGGGGLFFIFLLLLVIGGGAAYYFLMYKPAAEAPPATAAATPKPTVKPVATPAPTKPTNLSASEREKYTKEATESFKELRAAKLQPFSEAFAAFISAGNFSAASLPSKEAIAARRELIKKCLAANDDYAAFVKDQEKAFAAELKKTPLTSNDVEVIASLTAATMPTDKIVQLRTIQGESLKTSDQILAYLDSTFGGWSVNAEKHIVFKKPADGTPFNALLKTYGEQTTALNKLKEEINANTSDPTAPGANPGALPTAAANSPAVSPVAPAGSPAASPLKAATP